MMINLSKVSRGQKINLSKVAPGVTGYIIEASWDANRFDNGKKFDLDLVGVLCDANGNLLGMDVMNLIYPNLKAAEIGAFSNLVTVDGSVKHTGDNQTGSGDGPDETITFDTAITNGAKLALIVNIDGAKEAGLNFGMVKNAKVVVKDKSTGQAIVQYDLEEDFSAETGVVVAEIYNKDNEWRFSAVGAGYSKGLDRALADYGIQAEYA